MNTCLEEMVDFYDQNFTAYFSAREINKYFILLGMVADISRELYQYLQENSIFLLSDSAGFIQDIIDSNDTPFIYEKVGNRYSNFMIDEFQDTSMLQWENFKPLLENSLAMGHKNLIVGDVKQAIYRWRNSNWKILAEEINKDFSPEVLKHEVLSNNWRSKSILVELFNEVFFRLPKLIQHDFNELVADSSIKGSVKATEFQSSVINAYHQHQRSCSKDFT